MAEFEDQVLVTLPQNLTTNKIKTFMPSIMFFFVSNFSQLCFVKSIELIGKN